MFDRTSRLQLVEIEPEKPADPPLKQTKIDGTILDPVAEACARLVWGANLLRSDGPTE